MLKLTKYSGSGFLVTIIDKDGEILVKKAVDSEAEGLGYLSHLTATLLEGYRNNDIVKEGF